MKAIPTTVWAIALLSAGLVAPDCAAQDPASQNALNRQVRAFLDANRRQWRDMNVSEVDGQKLFDLVVENGYTTALELGTSTGHSAIWIAWAMSKTGGTLITLEIDERRYNQALENFEAAGLSRYIDARLADAHELVYEIKGPFDFIFVDADKDWYPRYFEALLPKLTVGGCFTAHNVSDRGRRGMRGMAGFVEALESTPNLETEFFRAGGGLSVSYKRAPN
ncbi:MAG: class I SAM-dependent methyltransferase [Gemmatimonadota bacterium]|nr:class I SAM-dependent methyltransferase [Gemmatimonadota bacterium]MDH3367450.1 class I SAM-dependent methyltransferase [Gemmatimonadota bacterium]MDH3569750.1 class I SAM-dependent methyltransferase [Gemmatimonadota bacterium]